MRVPSTLKCSSLVSPAHCALILTRSKKLRASSSLKIRSRLTLTEGGRFLFELETDKPAIKQVVADGFDQEPLGADEKQDLQQEGFEEHFERHRVYQQLVRIALIYLNFFNTQATSLNLYNYLAIAQSTQAVRNNQHRQIFIKRINGFHHCLLGFGI